MISDFTKSIWIDAIKNPTSYRDGSGRKKLQVTYDKMLDEISLNIFGTGCQSRVSMRQQLNAMPEKTTQIKLLLEMMKNDHLIFDKDYRDHTLDVDKFLTNHVAHFLKVI